MMLKIYYDEWCPRCIRWAHVLQRFVGRHVLDIHPLRTQGAQQSVIDLPTALRALPLIDEHNEVHYGFDALLLIGFRITWAWPFRPLLWLLNHTGLGARCYNYLASKRKIVHCHMSDCSPKSRKT